MPIKGTREVHRSRYFRRAFDLTSDFRQTNDRLESTENVGRRLDYVAGDQNRWTSKSLKVLEDVPNFLMREVLGSLSE